MTHRELLDLARELDARGVSYALVTVVRAVAPTSAYVGAQAIVLADGTLQGWIGGGCAKNVVVAAAQEAIVRGNPKLVRVSNDRIQSDADIEQHPMSCASNGTLELFVQPYSARSQLCVLGETPAADEARFLADRLQIGLAESPDRAPIALVATQGQRDEAELERALRSSASHVLLIASRRKADRLRDAMRSRGIDATRLAKLVAPAGPAAGAKTPREIALVSMVGVLALLRGCPDAAAAVDAKPITAGASGTPDNARPNTPPARFVNPVCGTAVDTATALHVEAYGGTAYYFCCDGCWTTFRADPAKYAALHEESGARVPR